MLESGDDHATEALYVERASFARTRTRKERTPRERRRERTFRGVSMNDASTELMSIVIVIVIVI